MQNILNSKFMSLNKKCILIYSYDTCNMHTQIWYNNWFYFSRLLKLMSYQSGQKFEDQKLLPSFLTISVSVHTTEIILRGPQLKPALVESPLKFFSQETFNFYCPNSFISDVLMFSKLKMRFMRVIAHAILHHYLI